MCRRVFNKTIILLGLAGYEMIITNSALRASLGLSLGTLRYDDGKPLRRQRKDGKNWVEVAVLARNLGCYEVSKTATSKHKHSP